MRALVDQCLPYLAAVMLRGAGIDAVHTQEVGLAQASDADILKYAVTAGRFIATLDADFHEILALTRATVPSVLRIRDEHLTDVQVHLEILRVISEFQAALLAGAAITSRRGLSRIHMLPLDD